MRVMPKASRVWSFECGSSVPQNVVLGRAARAGAIVVASAAVYVESGFYRWPLQISAEAAWPALGIRADADGQRVLDEVVVASAVEALA